MAICGIAPVLNHVNFSQLYGKVAAEEITLFCVSLLCNQTASDALKEKQTI